MKPTTKEPKKTISGELALLVAVMINSFGVVLMLYSKAGISAISSVPYAFSLAWPKLSLGTWTYLFQARQCIGGVSIHAPTRGATIANRHRS